MKLASILQVKMLSFIHAMEPRVINFGFMTMIKIKLNMEAAESALKCHPNVINSG
uniref:Uncharacterized protein n=1 Tax=Tetranychus urticae TaxID=32264 RepID=T1KB11_TETUR